MYLLQIRFHNVKKTISKFILSPNLINFVQCLKEVSRAGDECQVTPVIHVLQYPGCVPKPIPSFACIGRCASYLQVRHSLIMHQILHFFFTDFQSHFLDYV